MVKHIYEDSDEFENSLKDSQIKIAAFIKVKLFVAMQIHQLSTVI